MPSGPSLSARLTAAVSRWAFHLRRCLRLRGRIAPVVLVCGVVAGIALCPPVVGPVVGSADNPAVDPGSTATASANDSRTSRSERSDAVQEDVDGAGAPSAVPGASPGTTGAAPGNAAETPAADVPADTSTAG